MARLSTISALRSGISYLFLPSGLAAIWATSAIIVFARARRTDGPAGVSVVSPAQSFLRGAAIAVLLALSPIAIIYATGFIALRIGCDLNEVAEHPCRVLGLNVGPLLQTMSQSIRFISLTVMAGLLR